MKAHFAILLLLVGAVSGSGRYAELKSVKTTSSSFSVEHGQLTECHGGLYYTVSSTTSSDTSADGLYEHNDGDTGGTLLVQSATGIRGLTCHQNYLYYFKKNASEDASTTMVWGLYRFSLDSGTTGSEGFIYDATNISHHPLVNYEGSLFMGGQGPKLYEVTLSTSEPMVDVIWDGGSGQDTPRELVVHKGEIKKDLYFVADDSQGRASFWRFSDHTGQTTRLHDLVLRTGTSEASVSYPISYKGTQDYQASLYMSLGSFDILDGHNRLVKWDEREKKMPAITPIKEYDPSHMIIFQDDLYMVLRDSQDVTKYSVWSWNGRFEKQQFSLPYQARIKSLTVWDDILVAAGDSGPLVVWNGKVSQTVAVTTSLSDVKELVAFDGDLLISASDDPAQNGNSLWSLTMGIFKAPGEEPGDTGETVDPTPGGPTGSVWGSPFDSEDEAPDDSPGSFPQVEVVKVSGDRNGWSKALIVLFVLSFLAGLCWWAYKKRSGNDQEFHKSFSNNSWDDHELSFSEREESVEYGDGRAPPNDVSMDRGYLA